MDTAQGAATSRLTRLAACYAARLSGLGPAELDARSGTAGEWTLREVVHHVSNVTYYAEAVGLPAEPAVG